MAEYCFALKILTAEKTFYDGECVSLIIPTSEGMYGIKAHHINLVAAVAPGVITIRTANESFYASVGSGILKVENNTVLILAETAEHPEEIDKARALHAAEEAREALLHKENSKEFKEAKLRLARELGRLDAIRHEENHGSISS